VPTPGGWLLALGWSTPKMSGLEARLAGAAQLSPVLRELKGHGGWLWGVVFSADGARIVTASADGTAREWDAGSGEMRVLKGHGGAVTSAAFSADGARIVIASEDRTARVWDTRSGETDWHLPMLGVRLWVRRLAWSYMIEITAYFLKVGGHCPRRFSGPVINNHVSEPELRRG
jgi:WD40 repeat protein